MGVAKRWRRQAVRDTTTYVELARSYCDNVLVSLVDLRDNKWIVPHNRTASTCLPFNTSIEVLSDGRCASHKAHYSTNYSTKMGEHLALLYWSLVVT